VVGWKFEGFVGAGVVKGIRLTGVEQGFVSGKRSSFHRMRVVHCIVYMHSAACVARRLRPSWLLVQSACGGNIFLGVGQHAALLAVLTE
jgi:hypothetical protein